MLKISDLHFAYSRRSPEALCGIDLELNEGEIGILLGKNGAGKTTLFSNILGIEKPKSGTVFLDNEDITAMPQRERAKRIAYVPQNISFGALSVFDTVLMGRIAYFGLRAGKDDIAKTEKILDEMKLSSLKDRNADLLSGGEKQKVAIARAMSQEPRLMIFDEPTGSLDLANEQLLVSQIKKLSREKNITVLIALHDINTALSLGDRFFFMKDGLIHFSCGKDEVTPEIINDTFDVNIKIVEVENRKIILGGDAL